MPSARTELQIFVASPGDVQKERDRLEAVVNDLNNNIARSRNLILHLVQWKTHTHPGLGEDAQTVINQQISPTDIFIGIMWKRLGTRTKRAASGTVEEFQRAYELWKKNPQTHVMFYFNRAPVSLDNPEIKQLKQVNSFRSSVSKSGLIADYKGIKDFEKQVRSHLSKLVLEWNIVGAGDAASDSSAPVCSAVPSNWVPVWPPPPQQPGLFVGREEGLQEIRRRLGISQKGLPAGDMQPITAIWGIGGVGKTTLAAALTYDPDVRAAFPHGLLWTTLGETPTLLSAFARWGNVLGKEGKKLAGATTLSAARDELSRLLQTRRMLLIVDDVWETKPGLEFKLIRGPYCAIVFTTRERQVASELTDIPSEQVYNLPPLTPQSGLKLLRFLAPSVVDEYPEKCLELVRDLGCLPLALQVAGRLLYAEAEKQRGMLENLLAELRTGKKLLKAKENQVAPTVAVLLKRSTDRLDKTTRERFAMLGVCPKPAIVDEKYLKVRWRVKDPNPTIDILVSRGLLEPIGDGKYQLHALLVSLADSLLED
jgi:hypothetical protein